MDVAQQKADLRADVRRRLAGLPPKERSQESRSLCRRLKELLPSPPITLCAFAPLRSEPDIFSLLQERLEQEDRIYLPRVEGGRIVFRRITDLRSLEAGAFNILEPSPEAAALDPSLLQHALIPGVAFDRKGNRLGRGNGGYDHWIRGQRSLNPRAVFWGVCFECQLMQDVPIEAHDERVDNIVTARGLFR